ncbi:TIGR02099 family protein [Dasania sp. GY-MA-18]|uniref:YhdP family protein n=1 Tax=Dasania phycosphaerae TaxID=2950436 RepID=A0A9J6RI17_9GAMM|nr:MULTISPECIES: YhdP family protein [Dasania]MCR8921582.1 TIGR02099 family protein [Dasania sp. GY-MA-18]MCZ0864010.1 YhdP family protein [Dasania phycosphaerae]MCZ0867738.1 YhdP family protein [Dasania phycosphaerae]
MIKQCTTWLRRCIKLVLLTALLLVASYASLGRYYIDYVEKYQRVLVGYFVEYTGLPVAVGSISGSWSQLSFILSFNDIVLHGSNQQVLLSIPQANFKVNPLQSLWHRRFLIDSVSVEGLTTRFKETAPGKWSLAGFEYELADNNAALDLDQLLDAVLAIDRLEFFDNHIDLQYYKDKRPKLYTGELFLRHHQGFRRIHLQANLQDAYGVDENGEQQDEPINLLIESLGDPRDKDFTAQAYVKFDAVDLVEQLPVLHSVGLKPKELTVDSTIWLDWQPGRVITVQGKMSTPLFDLGSINQQAIPTLKNVALSFRAEKNAEHEWQLWLPRIAGEWQGQALNIQESIATLGPDALAIAFTELNLQQLSTKLLSLNVLPVAAQQALSTLAPKGDLRQIKISIARKPSTEQLVKLASQFTVQAELEDVALEAWHGAPAANNIDGFLELNEQGGAVTLSSEPFEIAFPGIYANSMRFDVAKAKVAWRWDAETVYVDSGIIDVRSEYGPAVALLALRFPRQPDAGDPSMFLAVGLTDTPASNRDKFIPEVLSEDLLAWLDSSIQGGDIQQGGFIYNGSLAADGEQERSVQLYLEVANGELDYQPGWPALNNIQAQVFVDDGDVDVYSPSAVAKGIALSNTRVKVNQLADGEAWLSVAAQLEGDAQHALDIVNSGNLREIVGDAFADWQLKGDISASLNLGLPLAQHSKLQQQVVFNSYIRAGDLRLPDYRLNFKEVYGPFEYSSANGVVSSGLQGLLFNKKATVKIAQSNEQAVKVNIDGLVNMDDVEAWAQFAGMTYLRGQAQVQAELLLNSKHDHFSLSSDLKGVAIALPAPYKKASEDSADFKLNIPLGKEQTLLSMRLQNKLAAALHLTEQGVSGGALIFNPSGDEPIPEDEFVISGVLEHVNAQDVQDLLQRYLAKNAELDARAANKKSSQTQVEQSQLLAPPLRVDNLQIKQAHVFGLDLAAATVNVQQQQQAWVLELSSDKVQGLVHFPLDESQPMQLEVQSLHLSAADSDKRDAAIDENEATAFYQLKASVFDDINPADIPDIDVSIKEIYLDEALMGHLALQLRAQQNRLWVNNIYGEIRKLKLGGGDKPLSLSWLKSEQGGESQLSGAFSFADVGAVFEQWGYERTTESKSGIVAVDLSWPGAPDQWQMALSQGSISLDVKKGIFLKTAGSASGALRIVSVLNMNNILRRLRLDFTDLYKSGVSFDEVKGEFELVGGRLYIIEHLNIESPSSRFRLLGSTDLNAEVLDMDLIATLPIGKNLPWVAALMGGVPAAAIVYGASKLFENQVDKFSSAVYSLEGKWDDPQLKLKKVFDAKGQKRQQTHIKSAGGSQ